MQAAVQMRLGRIEAVPQEAVSLGEAGEGGGQTLLSTSVAENFTARWTVLPLNRRGLQEGEE